MKTSKESLDQKKGLEETKEMLLARKRELEQQLTELSFERFSDETVKDPGDEALSLTMDSIRETLKETEHAEYSRILKALEMIDTGTYGICIECGQPIKEKRLKHFPNATRCLVCQERFEMT